MQIGILSDTHLADAAHVSVLTGVVRRAFKDVDYIIHAGDFTSEIVLHELELIAPVLACHGNSDSPALKRRLPRFATRTFEALRVGVTHRMPNTATIRESGVRILVTGHTHVPKIEESALDVLLLNPGSPTRPRAPPPNKFLPSISREAVPTLILLHVTGDHSSAFLLRLGAR